MVATDRDSRKWPESAMKQLFKQDNIGNIGSIPASLNSTVELRRYVNGLDHEEKRRILLDIESKIKRIAGHTSDKDGKYHPFGFDELYDLSRLVEMRCIVLNEMMNCPTAEEVMRLETVNSRLLGITKEMYRQTVLMRHVFNMLPEEERLPCVVTCHTRYQTCCV